MIKWWIFCFFCYPFLSWANDAVRGQATFFQKEIYIGQTFFLDIEVKAPMDIKVQAPITAPSINGLDIVNNNPLNGLEVIKSEDSLIYKVRFAYVAFDSITGNENQILIPYSQNNIVDTFAISIQNFQVHRIPVDTTDALRREYEPLYTSTKSKWYIYIIVIASVLLLSVLGGLYYWKHNKNRLSIPLNKNPREWAFEQLKDLENRIPFVKEKEDWALLSNILRLYMERVWLIPAPFFSSGEVLGAIASSRKYSSQLIKVSEVLSVCDQVKFARVTTNIDEQNATIQKVRDLIGFDELEDSIKEEVKDE
ncbi:MAG: hypothetical protein LC105_02380 [Chitinophagales bacterium]|nr:hypothetical protein [Chitinophagales bacterium]MCZ2392690.1 hypothetical protein [Chitinophagales bacterium]